MTEPRTFTLSLPPGTPILTANNRMHYYARNKRVQDIRETVGEVLMCARRPEPFGKVTVLVTYASPPARKADRHPLASDAIRDADNIAPTAKACIDEMVRARILPTDARRCVRSVTYRLADEPHPRGLVQLTITEAEQ